MTRLGRRVTGAPSSSPGVSGNVGRELCDARSVRLVEDKERGADNGSSLGEPGQGHPDGVDLAGARELGQCRSDSLPVDHLPSERVPATDLGPEVEVGVVGLRAAEARPALADRRSGRVVTFSGSRLAVICLLERATGRPARSTSTQETWIGCILTVRLVPARAGSGHDGVEVGTGAGGQL